ncbi:MAG: beta-ACP synthase, partial [Pseudolabrys sp.]|nr:beta-ACP synthase [Pseudolabrys sp.]
MNRVVVTGQGVISPIGHNAADYWANLTKGVSGIGPITCQGADQLSQKNAGEVTGYDPLKYFSDKEIAPLDRTTQFAVIAAREALAQSGLTIDEPLSLRTAVIVGTGIGGQSTIDESFRRLYEEKKSRAWPLTVPKLMPNAPASQVSMFLKLRGPAFGVVSACASATHAIGLAFQMVRSGMAEAAFAGGAESCISYGAMRSWEAMRVMSPDVCRPFSKDRKGMIIG